jgi:hypothetical protein
MTHLSERVGLYWVLQGLGFINGGHSQILTSITVGAQNDTVIFCREIQLFVTHLLWEQSYQKDHFHQDPAATPVQSSCSETNAVEREKTYRAISYSFFSIGVSYIFFSYQFSILPTYFFPHALEVSTHMHDFFLLPFHTIWQHYKHIQDALIAYFHGR